LDSSTNIIRVNEPSIYTVTEGVCEFPHFQETNTGLLLSTNHNHNRVVSHAYHKN